jgi:HAMP domain-containing protein
MEIFVLLGAVLIGSVSLVIWFNLTDEWAERDRLRRFQEAMRAGGREQDRYTTDDPRRPS